MSYMYMYMHNRTFIFDQLIGHYKSHLLIAAGLELLQYALVEFQFLFILSDLSVKFFTAVIMGQLTFSILGNLQFGAAIL